MDGRFEALRSKAAELNHEPKKHLDSVHFQVMRLQGHVERGGMSYAEIRSAVSELFYYTMIIPICIPLRTGQEITRAVRFSGKDGVGHADVSRLSYIPLASSIVRSLGRMNPAGQSAFYGCLGANENSMGAILSEVRAQDGEVFNVLFSRLRQHKRNGPSKDETLNLAPLGVFDYYRRGAPDPFRLHEDYQLFYREMARITRVEGMLAMQLTDAFLTDVLKRRETEYLYDVTSAIGAECMNAPGPLDGVLFPSTRFDGYPNAVLKPSAVDAKLEHLWVASIRVVRTLGYGIYETEALGRATIEEDRLVWNS